MANPGFEVITADQPWSDRYTYAPAVRVGNLFFISGTTATDENREIVGPGDIAAQCRYIYQKFEVLLNSVGATCSDIVQTVDYLTTTENYRATAEVRRELFPGAKTTATGVIVAGLLREDALIEISAIAVLPEDGR